MFKFMGKQIPPCNRQQGFSMMELVVVIAIAGVIAALTIPALISMRNKYQLRESASDMLSTFKRAQTEAVRKGVSVAVTITTGTPGTCTVFADDGSGGGVAKNRAKDGTEPTLLTTTTQPGTSLQNNTFAVIPEFSPGGTLTNACQAGSPPLPCNSLDVRSGASSTVQYRLTFSSAGHVTLLTSTDSGATFK